MNETETPSADSWYAQLGGDACVRSLAEGFYRQMDEARTYGALRAIHPEDLSDSVERFYAFLSGFLGGPSLYWQRYGHPRLRMRHGRFPIDRPMARQWVACMSDALSQTRLSEDQQMRLLLRFAEVADFMRNRPDPTSPSGSS